MGGSESVRTPTGKRTLKLGHFQVDFFTQGLSLKVNVLGYKTPLEMMLYPGIRGNWTLLP